MSQRKPYAAPAVEEAGIFSDRAEGFGSFLPDFTGSTLLSIAVVF